MKTKLLFGLLFIATLQFTNAQVPTAVGLIGVFNNWGGSPFVEMATTDNVNYALTSYYFPNGDFKFRQDGNYFGGTTFPSGTAAGSGGNITNTASDFYDISYNISTGNYSFTPVAFSNQHISLIGDFNGWAGDVALTTTNNTIYSVFNVAISGAGYKFRRDANWAVAYGDSGTPGTASPSGGNITAPTPGNYDFTFDIKTLAYTVTPTSTLAVDEFTKNIQFFYVNNALNINGYNGKASIKAYDIIGRLLYNKENVNIQNGFSQAIKLPKNQVSIILIKGENFTKSLEVIALY